MRCSIVEAIEKLGDKEVVPRLVQMLGDEGINEMCVSYSRSNWEFR